VTAGRPARRGGLPTGLRRRKRRLNYRPVTGVRPVTEGVLCPFRAAAINVETPPCFPVDARYAGPGGGTGARSG